MEPKLTLGMAIYDDFEGFWMTIQGFRMLHPELAGQVELVVVDNNFGSNHSIRCQDLVGGLSDKPGFVDNYFTRVVYHPFMAFSSTAQTRNAVFELAAAPLVVVTDPHVLFPRISVKRLRSSGLNIPDNTLVDASVSPFVLLLQFVDANPDGKNLIQGVYLMDDMSGLATHFDDVMRENMWGIWGFDQLAKDTFGNPLYHFGQGLGFFACKKNVWSEVGGFNRSFRGFGGEECYIHEKFRLIGESKGEPDKWRPVILPFWRGVHRFGHTSGTPYRNDLKERVANYLFGVRELSELKKDESYKRVMLSRFHRHFVLGINEDGSHKVGPNIGQTEWNNLLNLVFGSEVSDVLTPDSTRISPDHQVQPLVTGGNNQNQQLSSPDSSGGIGVKIRPVIEEDWSPTPIEEALSPVLATYGVSLDDPTVVKVYSDKLHHEVSSQHITDLVDKLLHNVSAIEPNQAEVIIIGGLSHGSNLDKVLAEALSKANRFVVVYGTSSYGTSGPLVVERDEGSERIEPNLKAGRTDCKQCKTVGLLPAIRKSIRTNPKWSVIRSEQTVGDYSGFVVLASQDQDKPKPPGIIKSAGNFIKSMASYVRSGLGMASDEEYNLRLTICSICPYLSASKACSLCGCPVERKAKLEVAQCDLGRWSDPFYRSQAETILQDEKLIDLIKQNKPTTIIPDPSHFMSEPMSQVYQSQTSPPIPGGCGCRK